EALCPHHCYDFLKGSARFIPRPRKGARLQNEFEVYEQGAEVTLRSLTQSLMMMFLLFLLISFSLLLVIGLLLRPASAGKKKAKQLHLEGQTDKDIMHSQRELAAATTGQVKLLKEQLQIAKRKVDLTGNQQLSLKEQAEMSMICATTEGLSEFGKEFLLRKQKQVLEQMRKQTLMEE
ncbi:hypothetical protein GN958_ATG14838, partial [Phytophthora infestans]